MCLTCALFLYKKHLLTFVTGSSTKRYGLVSREDRLPEERSSYDRNERKRQHTPPANMNHHSSQPTGKVAKHDHTRHKQRGEQSSSSSSRHGSSKSKYKEQKSHREQCDREQCWMASHLRVRIIDQGYHRGQYYNSKVNEPCWLCVLCSVCASVLCVCVSVIMCR